VRGRNVFAPVTCATTLSTATDACPVTMKAVVADPPEGDDAFRAGDVVRVDIALATTREVRVNAVQISLDFPVGDLRLVRGPSDATLVPASNPSVPVAPVPPLAVASGAFGVAPTVLWHQYLESTAGDTTTGQVDLDIGTNLPASGPTSPITLAPGTDTVIATAYLRVVRNVTGSISRQVTVRDSAAAGVRFSSVAIVGGTTTGLNALGPVASGAIKLARMVARLSLVPATPVAGTVRRIGDVVPVSLVVAPVTVLRNARAATAVATFARADLVLVGVPTPGDASPAPVAAGASAPFASTAGSVLAAPGAVPTILTSYVEDATTGTVSLTVSGGPLSMRASDEPQVIATVHLRPRHRGEASLTLASGVVLAPVPGTGAVDWEAQPDNVATASIPDVRGTVGVGLVATLPGATADGTAPALVAGAGGLALATGATVTDGRAIDVEVFVLAGPTDVTGTDRLAVDVTYDASVLDIPPAPTLGTDIALAPGYVADGGAVATATVPGTVRLSVKRDAGSVLDTSAPIARVRFVAKLQATGAIATGTFALGVGTGTELRRATSQYFPSNLYDAGRDAQTLDRLPVVVRQKPASLAVEAIVQGRNISDPDARFVQPLRISLRRSGDLVSPVRRYQPSVPATVATTGAPAIPVDVMRYVATSARKAGSASPMVSATFPDLEPGTYDVLVKGRSSVTVKLLGIVLTPGGVLTAPASAAPPLTLPEGDTDGNDAVNGADFAVLSRTFGTSSPESDFNQSGYVDAFDFALMARNYGLSGPVALATLATTPSLPVRATAGAAAATYRAALALPPGLVLDRARVVVSGSAALPVTCPATPVAGTTCTAETDTRVRLHVTGNGGVGAGGTVTMGDVAIAGAATGTANLTVTLTDAVGHDPAAPTVAVTVRAATLSSSVAVDPSATYRLSVAANADGTVGVGLGVTVAAGVHATAGRATIAYDASLLVADGACSDLAPGVTCDATVNGRVTFTMDPAVADLQGNVASIGTVRLRARPGTSGSAAILGTIDDLADTAARPGHRTRLVTAPASVGADTSSVTVGGGVVATAAVRAASVRVSTTGAVQAQSFATSPSSSPLPSISMATVGGPVAAGSVVPVDIGVSTGGRVVDAVQVALAVAPGFEVVGASGEAVGSSTPVAVADGSPWPVALHQQIDPVTGQINVAFGRQVGGGLAGVVGDGAVGTIYLRVTAGARTVDALSVVSASSRGFRSGLAVAGLPVPFTPGSLAITVSDTAPVVVPDAQPVVTAPAAPEIPVLPWVGDASAGAPTPSGVVGNGTGPVLAAVRSDSGAIADLRRTADGLSTVNPASRTVTGHAWREDAVRGVIEFDVPGRDAPVTVTTGFATTDPDAWCPGPRYRTYVRLEDVGIAGATFGVGAGGVLDWVTPDRAGCVDWGAIRRDGLTFTKETIMQFRLAHAAPGALLWVLEGDRRGELYEVDAHGLATHVAAEAFGANQAHYREAWANVIPVSTAQLEDVAARRMVAR
jgi:hypothetical protein